MIEADSLRKRYFFKLSGRFLELVLGLFTAGIIPRALGPALYGNYNFLTNFFLKIVNFLDLGTSTAFFTKLSARPKERPLVSFYSYFVGLLLLAMTLFLCLAYLTPIYKILWPGQTMFFVFLAAGFGFSDWIIKIFTKMTDAYGLTVKAEIARVIQKIVSTVMILLLFFINRLDLANYFYLQYFVFSLFSLITFLIIQRHSYNFLNFSLINIKQFKIYLKEFYHYSHPLVVFGLVVMVAGILQRWLLQYFAGGVEQGYFSLSFNIARYCFVFTISMQPLLMREFSIAHQKNNLQQLAILFRRYIPLFYSIAAYFACFLAVQAGTLVHIFGGTGYNTAIVPLMIMSFYPIHQTYGQLSGSVFYATGQTSIYRNIGVTFSLLGLLLTFFLLAPSSLGGLGLGALGLALQMVVIQFFAVNTQLYFNAKYLRLPFLKYFIHQFVSVFFLLLSAFLVSYLINLFFAPANLIVKFLLSGLFYSFIALLLLMFFPILFGIKKTDLVVVIDKIRKNIRRE